jgi:transcription elongation factor Elf1
MIRFACPHCQKRLKAPDQGAGRNIVCPRCGQRLSVPSPEPAKSSPPGAAPIEGEPVPGEVQMNCPGCGRTISLQRHELTLTIECAECNARFVPDNASAPPPISRESAADPSDSRLSSDEDSAHGAGTDTDIVTEPARHVIRFECPICNAVLESPDTKAGNTIGCPKCKHCLRVPVPPNMTIQGRLLSHDIAPDASTEHNKAQLLSQSELIGACSLALAIVSILFVILPCFWFLAVPISGLGVLVGCVGWYIALRRPESSRKLLITGTLLSCLLLVGSCALNINAQWRLSRAFDSLEHLRPR